MYRQQPQSIQLPIPGFPGFPGGGSNVNQRLDRLERQIQRLENQYDRLDRRLDRIERRLGFGSSQF